MEKYGLNLNLTADAATILALKEDAEMLALVKGKFAQVCSACHKPEGTGTEGLGPNLTDKHWKNVKDITDIYQVLDVGVPGTAMVSQASLSKDEKILMAAYVAKMSETPKEGLAPEGELIPVWPSAVEAATGRPKENSKPEGEQ